MPKRKTAVFRILQAGSCVLAIPRFFGRKNNSVKEKMAMLRTAVFNDGENFRHNICGLFAGPPGAPFDPARDLFDRRNYLPRADWEGFFGHLVKESQIQEIPTLTRAYWYVTGAVDAWPWKFPKVVENPSASNTAEMAEWHRKNLGHIQELVEFDRQSPIQLGYPPNWRECRIFWGNCAAGNSPLKTASAALRSKTKSPSPMTALNSAAQAAFATTFSPTV